MLQTILMLLILIFYEFMNQSEWIFQKQANQNNTFIRWFAKIIENKMSTFDANWRPSIVEFDATWVDEYKIYCIFFQISIVILTIMAGGTMADLASHLAPTYKPAPVPTYKQAPTPTYKPTPAPTYKTSPYKTAPVPTYKQAPAYAYNPAPGLVYRQGLAP